MFDKTLKLIAIDKETREKFIVHSIFFPLGKPSGKDVAVICKEDSEITEWKSIDEVVIEIIPPS
ncbi:hypothetical protein [Sporosarcina sp. OR05]|uniref:hypothetical protein n=1 Tax=Sporosarcina sp. OR05 TaxID=2969819 RepID=UPI00352A37EA